MRYLGDGAAGFGAGLARSVHRRRMELPRPSFADGDAVWAMGDGSGGWMEQEEEEEEKEGERIGWLRSSGTASSSPIRLGTSSDFPSLPPTAGEDVAALRQMCYSMAQQMAAMSQTLLAYLGTTSAHPAPTPRRADDVDDVPFGSAFARAPPAPLSRLRAEEEDLSDIAAPDSHSRMVMRRERLSVRVVRKALIRGHIARPRHSSASSRSRPGTTATVLSSFLYQ